MTAIEARIAKLEWRLRILGIVSVAALGSLALVLFGGAAPAPNKAIEAESIVFRDSQGRIRMELKHQQNEKDAEEFGLYFTNADGEKVGSLREAGGLCLIVEASARSRKVAEAAAWDIGERMAKPEERGQLERDKKEHLASLEKLGRTLMILSHGGMLLREDTPAGTNFSHFFSDSVVARSITVKSNPDIETNFGTKAPPGAIQVIDGSIAARSSKDKRMAVLGANGLTNRKTGDLIQTPVSSLTICDEDGHIVFKAP